MLPEKRYYRPLQTEQIYMYLITFPTFIMGLKVFCWISFDSVCNAFCCSVQQVSQHSWISIAPTVFPLWQCPGENFQDVCHWQHFRFLWNKPRCECRKKNLQWHFMVLGAEDGWYISLLKKINVFLLLLSFLLETNIFTVFIEDWYFYYFSYWEKEFT